MSRNSDQVTPPPLQLARWSTSLLFFLNGTIFATWATRIPAVQAKLMLSTGELGIALLGTAFGALATLSGRHSFLCDPDTLRCSFPAASRGRSPENGSRICPSHTCNPCSGSGGFLHCAWGRGDSRLERHLSQRNPSHGNWTRRSRVCCLLSGNGYGQRGGRSIDGSSWTRDHDATRRTRGCHRAYARSRCHLDSNCSSRFWPGWRRVFCGIPSHAERRWPYLEAGCWHGYCRS